MDNCKGRKENVDDIDSYQSAIAQYDLDVRGSSKNSFYLMEYLHLPPGGRGFIIEAKDRKTRVSTEQFLRICALLQNTHSSTVHLGVFFTRKGASGFPTPDRNVQALNHSRAVQALFHAKTEKYVVVFDKADIAQLKEAGGLLKMLRLKIEEIEKGTGEYLAFHKVNTSRRYVMLPDHLARLKETALIK